MIDVSFISLAKILPAVAGCLAGRRSPGDGQAAVRARPRAGRQGVVRDAGDRREAILAVARAAGELELPVRGFASSGLPGPKGNRETFVWCGGVGVGIDDLESAVAEVDV